MPTMCSQIYSCFKYMFCSKDIKPKFMIQKLPGMIGRQYSIVVKILDF